MKMRFDTHLQLVGHREPPQVPKTRYRDYPLDRQESKSLDSGGGGGGGGGGGRELWYVLDGIPLEWCRRF